MAATKGRRVRTGGYYADPASPIASTPQRPRRTGFSTSASIPEAPLSPMKMPHPLVAPARESFGGGGKVAEEDDGGWRGSIFSPVFQPVLKLVGMDGGTGTSPASGTGAALAGAGAAGAGVAAYAPSSPHSTLSRSDGTGSSSGTSSVAACSLGSPSLYAHAAHTPTPPRRQPSPITTPASTPTTPVRGGHVEDAPSMYAAHAAAMQSVQSPAATSSSLVAAADESWEATDDDMEDDDGFDDFNPYLFIKLLPTYEDVAPKLRKIVLPKKLRSAPHVSLVLDLDETLVHCSIEPIRDADLTFNVEFNGQDYEVYVRKRPFLAHFLEQVSKMFEVTVFTASQSVYAEKLLNLIDPRRRLVKHRLFREACLNVDGNYLKDLTVLGRDLRHTVLVDNSPHAFGYQVDNGIPIESWFDDPSDTELLKLLNFLKTIQHAKDVRPHVRRKFRMWDLINAA